MDLAKWEKVNTVTLEEVNKIASANNVEWEFLNIDKNTLCIKPKNKLGNEPGPNPSYSDYILVKFVIHDGNDSIKNIITADKMNFFKEYESLLKVNYSKILSNSDIYINPTAFERYNNDIANWKEKQVQNAIKEVEKSIIQTDEANIVETLPLEQIIKEAEKTENNIEFNLIGADKGVSKVEIVPTKKDSTEVDTRNRKALEKSDKNKTEIFRHAGYTGLVTISPIVMVMYTVFGGLIMPAISGIVSLLIPGLLTKFALKKNDERFKNSLVETVENKDYIIAEYYVKNDKNSTISTNFVSQLNQAIKDKDSDVLKKNYNTLSENSTIVLHKDAFQEYNTAIAQNLYADETKQLESKDVTLSIEGSVVDITHTAGDIAVIKSMDNTEKIVELSKYYDNLTTSDKRNFDVCVKELIEAHNSFETQLSFVNNEDKKKNLEDIIERVNTVMVSIAENVHTQQNDSLLISKTFLDDKYSYLEKQDL